MLCQEYGALAELHVTFTSGQICQYQRQALALLRFVMLSEQSKLDQLDPPLRILLTVTTTPLQTYNTANTSSARLLLSMQVSHDLAVCPALLHVIICLKQMDYMPLCMSVPLQHSRSTCICID